MFYAKLDLKQAFHNIPVHKQYQHVTQLMFAGIRFNYNRLTFWLSLVIMQMHLNEIAEVAQRYVEYSWGYMVDIMLGYR